MESQCHFAATIRTGGAAYEVSTPPMDTFTKSTATVAYINREKDAIHRSIIYFENETPDGSVEISVRPELSDAKLGLPGKDVTWQTRRTNMVDVCLNCHNQHFVNSFYQQYDALIDLYHDKFAKPGMALYQAAKPLLRPAQFSNPIDFTWYEIWHHEGRRARHGASMMGPDYTHWHGTYEVSKHFYTKMVPELEAIIRAGKQSGDAKKAVAAGALQTKLDEVLNSPNHRWYLDKMDPGERDERRQRQEEFKRRYSQER